MSNLLANAWKNLDGTENFKCRAWVSLLGTSGAIRASGNISSVTRVSTGIYTIAMVAAMPDTNYSVLSGGSLSTTNNYCWPNVFSNGAVPVAPSVSSFSVSTAGGASIGLGDSTYLNLGVFR